MRWKYRKLLLNLGNAVEAVCGAPARPAVGLVMDEGAAVLGRRASTRSRARRTWPRRGELLR